MSKSGTVAAVALTAAALWNPTVRKHVSKGLRYVAHKLDPAITKLTIPQPEWDEINDNSLDPEDPEQQPTTRLGFKVKNK